MKAEDVWSNGTGSFSLSVWYARSPSSARRPGNRTLTSRQVWPKTKNHFFDRLEEKFEWNIILWKIAEILSFLMVLKFLWLTLTIGFKMTSVRVVIMPMRNSVRIQNWPDKILISWNNVLDCSFVEHITPNTTPSSVTASAQHLKLFSFFDFLIEILTKYED